MDGLQVPTIQLFFPPQMLSIRCTLLMHHYPLLHPLKTPLSSAVTPSNPTVSTVQISMIHLCNLKVLHYSIIICSSTVITFGEVHIKDLNKDPSHCQQLSGRQLYCNLRKQSLKGGHPPKLIHHSCLKYIPYIHLIRDQLKGIN